MKYLIIILSLISSFGFAQTEDKIHWMSFEEMQEAQKTAPKQVFVDVYTKWCGPCKMLSNTTFKDSAVIAYMNANFYAVKFDAESGDSVVYAGKTYKNPNYDPAKTGRNGVHELTYAIAPVNGRVAYPTLLFIGSDLKVITGAQGYVKAPQFLLILQFINEKAYLQNISFEDFVKSKSQS